MTMEMVKELNLGELENISAGYIIKDENGYNVIHDTEGYLVHTFTEEEYDLMMRFVTRSWKFSPEYITWEQAEEIHRKSLEEYYKAHPEKRRN